MQVVLRSSLLVATVVSTLVACGDDGSSVSPDAMPAPTLTAVAATSGTVSTEVTLSGTNLGTTAGVLSFGTEVATVSAWTDTSITATVPDVLPGEVSITAQTASGTSNALAFEVILPPAIYLEASVDGAANTLLAFRFDAASGDVLTPMASSPITLGGLSTDASGCYRTVAVHEPTRRLFVGSATAIDVFDLDPVSGLPAPVAGSPLPTREPLAMRLASR